MCLSRCRDFGCILVCILAMLIVPRSAHSAPPTQPTTTADPMALVRLMDDKGATREQTAGAEYNK